MSSANETNEQRYNKVYGSYINVDNSEKTVENYTNHAETYERDFVGFGYDTPNIIAVETIKLLSNLHADLKQLEILDIACGTGLVAQGLRFEKFQGVIDGIDGSKGMLALAEKTKLYRLLRQQFISPDEPLPYADNAYDAIVCCGGFGPGHLKPQVLSDLVRVTKLNGIIVFATRDNNSAEGYVKFLNDEIDALVKAGKWKEEKIFQTKYFNCDATASGDKQGEPLLTRVYCYKKN